MAGRTRTRRRTRQTRRMTTARRRSRGASRRRNRPKRRGTRRTYRKRTSQRRRLVGGCCGGPPKKDMEGESRRFEAYNVYKIDLKFEIPIYTKSKVGRTPKIAGNKVKTVMGKVKNIVNEDFEWMGESIPKEFTDQLNKVAESGGQRQIESYTVSIDDTNTNWIDIPEFAIKRSKIEQTA